MTLFRNAAASASARMMVSSVLVILAISPLTAAQAEANADRSLSHGGHLLRYASRRLRNDLDAFFSGSSDHPEVYVA